MEKKDYRGWCWISWYMIAVIVGLTLLISCRSHKQVQNHAETTAQTEQMVSSTETHHSENNFSRWLAMMADSLQWSFKADSVLLPNGDKLYNPEVNAKVIKPQMEQRENSTSASEDSAAIIAETTTSHHDKSETLESKEMTSSSPFSWSCLLCPLLLAIVGLFLWRWWKGM